MTGLPMEELSSFKKSVASNCTKGTIEPGVAASTPSKNTNMFELISVRSIINDNITDDDRGTQDILVTPIETLIDIGIDIDIDSIAIGGLFTKSDQTMERFCSFFFYI